MNTFLNYMFFLGLFAIFVLVILRLIDQYNHPPENTVEREPTEAEPGTELFNPLLKMGGPGSATSMNGQSIDCTGFYKSLSDK